jgi:hypothetical protein
MIADNERIALFNSPTRVMKAERLLRKTDIPCRMIPAPREVAEGCALALRFTIADQKIIFSALGAADLLPRRLYGKQQGKLVALSLPDGD